MPPPPALKSKDNLVYVPPVEPVELCLGGLDLGLLGLLLDDSDGEALSVHVHLHLQLLLLVGQVGGLLLGLLLSLPGHL